MNTRIDVPMSQVMKDATFVVALTGVRAWRVRVWAGVLLIRLAAYVIGCGIRVDR